MTRNQLPEGVGKKIVEALKRQTEADVTPVSAEEISLGMSVPLTDIQDLPDLKLENLTEEIDLNDNIIVEEEIVNTVSPVDTYSPVLNEEVVKQPEPVYSEQPVFTASVNEVKSSTFEALKPEVKSEKIRRVSTSSSAVINIPSNVAVLKNLIASLPVGVTKQTGAQIIRQTLEAMGIPMNNVLREAQEVQEELNSSTRECMLKIQEYKTNILQLEQSVQEYQKNITQINDLVSLFLLTDRK